MERNDGRDHEDAERDQPMSGDAADRQADDEIGDVTAADKCEMDEMLVGRLVRG